MCTWFPSTDTGRTCSLCSPNARWGRPWARPRAWTTARCTRGCGRFLRNSSRRTGRNFSVPRKRIAPRSCRSARSMPRLKAERTAKPCRPTGESASTCSRTRRPLPATSRGTMWAPSTAGCSRSCARSSRCRKRSCAPIAGRRLSFPASPRSAWTVRSAPSSTKTRRGKSHIPTPRRAGIAARGCSRTLWTRASLRSRANSCSPTNSSRRYAISPRSPLSGFGCVQCH